LPIIAKNWRIWPLWYMKYSWDRFIFQSIIYQNFKFQGDICHGGIKLNQWITVFFMANADGSAELPPLVIQKSKIPR
jgi:hypothetical protein